MCVYSMVSEHYLDKWKQSPWWEQYVSPTFTGPTRAEFDKLRADVDECLALLKKAAKYDRDNNEPECELEEKKAMLRQIAKMVGVEFDSAMGGP